MKKSFILIFISIVLCNINSFGQDVNCKIKGTVHGRESDIIILIKIFENEKQGVKIPILDGHFEYIIKEKELVEYKLIFQDELSKGSWRPIYFFPDSSELTFDLFPINKFENNVIKGGFLNQKRKDFENLLENKFQPIKNPIWDMLDTLYDKDIYYSEAYKELNKELRNSKSHEEKIPLWDKRKKLEKAGLAYSKEAQVLKNKLDSINKHELDWQNSYINKNIDIFSYTLFYENLLPSKSISELIDVREINSIYKKYSKVYPNHPYTTLIQEILNANQTIKIGGKFIDFTTESLSGEKKMFSELAENKVVLINLWASWCGPCRALNKSMIPVYNKYHDKGFEIIGVAREYKKSTAFEKAIEKDSYPWDNYIELNDKYGIWNKYNISNAAGNTYLIDKNGEILAIHPSAEELDKILKEIYE